ncbi:coiled-coil domain-containing protein 160 homolog [Hoplias malabaricus]|uniref:coiled-coil domain-containing protein 160 homolog n=1 Tax=Hoplias malabaricus TaxID=27720 RepID=UPI00346276A3
MEVSNGEKQYERMEHHWVEKLFPPHFTFPDLLEGKSERTEEPMFNTNRFLHSERPDSKRQTYINVLKRIQKKEETIRWSNLAQPISRDDQHRGVENKGSCGPDWVQSGKTEREEKCIWNDKDISILRAALNEAERDRWRLKESLRSTEERLEREQEERKRLQDLLEELENHLDGSRKAASRSALGIRALKIEVHQKNTRIQKLFQQSLEKAQETDELRAELRRTREGYQQFKQECLALASELGSIKERQKMERARLVEEALYENQAATVKLQKELEEARAELRAEKVSHRRSLTALELLRRHFNNQRPSAGQ